jgi:hypothetical protein
LVDRKSDIYARRDPGAKTYHSARGGAIVADEIALRAGLARNPVGLTPRSEGLTINDF